MNPRIKKAKLNQDYTFSIIFANDEKGIFDIKPYLEIGSFKDFKDFEKLRKFRIVDGVITWYNELDIAPDTVYLKSEKQK
ncbi:MAG: hypothetical protein A2X64_05035 [Ignavibacteria bacterium GWF2_33_9]|nr:MAG: hypothetical protein A2X64_05035 [Ignavibacteria bacterium GWF2_33_9]